MAPRYSGSFCEHVFSMRCQEICGVKLSVAANRELDDIQVVFFPFRDTNCFYLGKKCVKYMALSSLLLLIKSSTIFRWLDDIEVLFVDMHFLLFVYMHFFFCGFVFWSSTILKFFLWI